MPEIHIQSLRGGLNNTDTPAALADDQVVVCENIDFDRSTLGGKRRGTMPVDLTAAILAGSVVWLFRHLPTSDERKAQLWAISIDGANVAVNYKDTAWNTVVPVAPDAIPSEVLNYNIEGQSLHGKLFLAVPTVREASPDVWVPVDRLHVWDGTVLRRVGLAEPAAPSVANTGSGTYTTTRYFRVRYTEQSGAGATLRRSEPSDSTTFTPSGTGSAARITKPAAIAEGETHWEVEASIDNVLFYRIATVAVGTTTYDDSSPAIYSTNPLSPDIGDYSLPWSAKYLAADGDRLLFAGSWVNPDYASRVAWTPVWGGPGAGNDERLEEDTDPFVDLDGFSGGEITDLAGPLNGYIYAFKRSAIYKLVRTGARTQAYQAIQLTTSKGALPRSVVEGVDEQGNACLYFLDPNTGPHRIGSNGIEECGGDISETWKKVNLNATVVAHGMFYPDKRQIWYWLATVDGEGEPVNFPNIKLVGHTREMRRGPQGVRRGWAIHTGPSAQALTSTMFSTNVDDNTDRSLQLKPFIGITHETDIIQMADTGTTDNEVPYRGRTRTKPFRLGNLLKRTGVTAAALEAEATPDTSVNVTLVRDYGKETKVVSVSLAPSAAGESRVVKPIDNAALSELYALQIELGDVEAADADWALDSIALKIRGEEAA